MLQKSHDLAMRGKTPLTNAARAAQGAGASAGKRVTLAGRTGRLPDTSPGGRTVMRREEWRRGCPKHLCLQVFTGIYLTCLRPFAISLFRLCSYTAVNRRLRSKVGTEVGIGSAGASQAL